LPDALDLWVAHSLKWYRQWDLAVTGFNIDGNTPPMTDRGFAAYQKFSPGGVGLQRAPSPYGVRGGLPYLQSMTDLPTKDSEPVDETTVTAVSSFFEMGNPHFVLVRSILESASYYAELQKRLQAPGIPPNKLVDVPTLLWLVRESQNDPRCANDITSYADKPSVSATPESKEGLRPRTVADGVPAIVKVDGKSLWRVEGGKSPFLYFDVANDFAKSIAGGKVRVRVTYLDAAPGMLGMHYDSTDPTAPLSGAYKAAAQVKMAGTGQAVTAEFNLPDARFDGRQNNSCDFRLEAAGKPMQILSVQVEKM
jgi:hypothetical protein